MEDVDIYARCRNQKLHELSNAYNIYTVHGSNVKQRAIMHSCLCSECLEISFVYKVQLQSEAFGAKFYFGMNFF